MGDFSKNSEVGDKLGLDRQGCGRASRVPNTVSARAINHRASGHPIRAGRPGTERVLSTAMPPFHHAVRLLMKGGGSGSADVQDVAGGQPEHQSKLAAPVTCGAESHRLQSQQQIWMTQVSLLASVKCGPLNRKVNLCKGDRGPPRSMQTGDNLRARVGMTSGGNVT